MRSLVKNLFFLSFIIVINSISLNKTPFKNSDLNTKFTQTKENKLTCLYGYKYESITGINTPIRLTRNFEVECLSFDGKNCLTKEITSDGQCASFMLENEGKFKPLVCGAMLKKLTGSEGYGDKNHWCEKGKKWFYNTWHCENETGIKTGVRVDFQTKNIECLSENGTECHWNDFGACMRTIGNPRNCRFIKPLRCGSDYVKSHGNPNPYYAASNHWCKLANTWFFGASEWICGGNDYGQNTPFRYNENGDIECFSIDGKECSWGNGTGKTCIDYIKNNLKNINPLICGSMHKMIYGGDGYENEGHWCRDLMDKFVYTTRGK